MRGAASVVLILASARRFGRKSVCLYSSIRVKKRKKNFMGGFASGHKNSLNNIPRRVCTHNVKLEAVQSLVRH